ncbi:hypothetical protein [Arthrobacter sp. zg-Y1110]|uniref:hypothetical protein n=1 Tax=Arthrobacter sp. zg-Y1110 TaxID=2886932 RepID=UPI001D13FD5F|nr:hypothetical protein [Arthrobacter sp. zg-Y1110]MCC3292612.1 hypothetical protein [Arthrobacter sp. zg-Y1110]UWX86957.1 hypothetical protein N2K99_16525 [Arthrobacter sp. zg-Y1110]
MPVDTCTPRHANGRFALKDRAEAGIVLGAADPEAETAQLLAGFTGTDPRLDIWRRYPDITEDEDEATDDWACGEVSAQFADYARSEGWDAEVVEAQADDPWADLHVWVQLRRDGRTVAVDWTARQYHNLKELSRDPKVLAAPWPLTWDPDQDPGEHPFMGSFTPS